MGILAKRFPEYGVTLQIFRGAITREAWVEYYASFAATASDRFVTYICPSADLSNMDLAFGPELKRLVAAKLREVFGDQPVISILVRSSNEQEPYLEFWRGFERVGDKHPAESVIVTDFKKACALLGLPDDAWRRLAAAVECEPPSL
jgi:hypothetical protein